MKVLYIHQHFVSTAGVGATRTHDICRHLAQRGHLITVVCGYSPTKGLPAVRPLRLWRYHALDGFRVVICNVSYNQEMTPTRRMLSFLQFAFIATLVGLWEKGVELVFATSTPLTVVIPGVIVARLRRRPYVFEARDLWPEDHVAAGRMRVGSLAHRFFAFLERVSYRFSKQITVVSEGFYNRLIERGISEEKLNMIPLGADGEKFKNMPPDHEFLKKNGLVGKKLAIYTGAHGKANGLDQVLAAAEHLRERADIALVFFGNGSEKASLIAAANARQLNNVHFFDPVPVTQLVGVLAVCHMGLIIFRQIGRPRMLTPNKFYDYCFAGIPSIVNFPGTTADIVLREQVGLTPDPGCPMELAKAIIHYADHETAQNAAGMKALRLGFENYDRAAIAVRMENLFAKALSARD